MAACSLTGCGGDDGVAGDELGDGTTGTATDTGTSDTNTESGETVGTTADSTTDSTTTASDTTDSTTTASDTTDSTTTASDTTDSTTGEGLCGNSIIEPGEECDDGNLSDQDGCLSSCAASSCGDGFINMGVEACDDGVNDGSYGGCAAGCAALGPYCGDGQFDIQNEACDDGNLDLTDGCLDNCVIPASCLTLLDYDDSLTDGEYDIAPNGYVGDPFPVWCDMISDGGGYTFLKIDAGAQTYAAEAEAECASYGMQLWIPRSITHKNSGWTIANDNNIGNASSPDFMRILGIYPNIQGSTCANQSMNSSNPNCGWDASDNGAWYVHDVNNISEPNGDNSTTGSMYYQWQGGQIQWHNDIGGAGYSSSYFMCDVADKQP